MTARIPKNGVARRARALEGGNLRTSTPVGRAASPTTSVGTLSAALSKATADRKLTTTEWDASLAPLLASTPHQASPQAREVLKVFVDNKLDVEEGALEKMSRYLLFCGYDTKEGRPTGCARDSFQALTGSNVTEPDVAFEAFCTRAQRDKEEVPVAILDLGFDLNHDALARKLWSPGGASSAWDFVSNASEVNSEEQWGHATHLCGIATRGTDRVKLIPIRAYEEGENWSAKHIPESIEHAIANDARIINMSFIVKDPDDKRAIVETMRHHPSVLFVKSAGNEGFDVGDYDQDEYLSKTKLPNLAVVAAADEHGVKLSYSNHSREFVTHAAVGKLVSTLPRNSFDLMGGTSHAAPNLVSAAAKMLILDPELHPEQLKWMLADTGDKRADWTELSQSGGLINAERAYGLAAFTGLVRRGAMPEEALDRLAIPSDEREQMLRLLSKYLEHTGRPS